LHCPAFHPEIEQYLAKHRPNGMTANGKLAARISGGAVGKARSVDLEAYVMSRKDPGVAQQRDPNRRPHKPVSDHRDLPGRREGKDKTDQLVAALYSLLKDLLALLSGTPELVRNTDVTSELKTLASSVSFQWITNATRQLGQFQNGMRRNVLRPVALDAFALSLERQL